MPALANIGHANPQLAEVAFDQMKRLETIARSLRGNTIQVSQPFIISDQELTLFVTALEQAITERENQ